MSGKIFIRILLLFCILISCLQSHISYSKVPARIKPRQNAWANGKKIVSQKWQNNYSQIVTQNFFLLNKVNIPKKPYQLASRAGGYKPDIVLTNICVEVQSIWPPTSYGQVAWPFLEKEFYKSFFSAAVDFQGLNKIVKNIYPQQPKPAIKKGAIMYLVVYDPLTEKNVYDGWFKANTDAAVDINSGRKKPNANTICLAVDSTHWKNFFSGKKMTVQFFCAGQIPFSILQQAKIDQGTIERKVKL